ncbi:Tubby c-terminal-like domain [Globisporangium polare]
MGSEQSVRGARQDVELVAQAQPVAAVSASYCRPTSSYFHITHQPVTPSRFIVRDTSTGLVCFHKEKRKALSTRQTLVDVSSDNSDNKGHVAVANAKNRTFSSSFHVLSGDSKSPNDELFQVYAKDQLNSSELHVDFKDLTTGVRYLMGLKGHWRKHKGYIWLDRGATGTREPVAKVWPHEKVHQTEVYTLEIASNVDVALVLVLCMILDERWRKSLSHTDR